MRRTITLFAAALTLAVALPVGAATAAPAAPTIAWTPCPDAVGVDCGTVTVPIDWARPGGPTVEIALARRRATDPAARIGSLLVDPGGPGGSGVEWVKSGSIFSPALTSRFDVVGFDPRGVGGSHPVLCDSDAETAPYPADPRSPAEFAQVAEHNRQLGESCRRLTGPLFEHLDTGSVVRDMDAIRAGLGEAKLTYYGVSYGTLMGQQYAETFPGRIRALVLDSNMDHSLGTWQFLRSETTGLQEVFEQFAAWSDRTPASALHGRDVRRIFADLYDRARRGVLYEPGTTRKITPLEVQNAVASTSYGPQWMYLATLMAQVAEPNPAALAAPHLGEPVADPTLAIFCQDWALPLRGYGELDVYRQVLALTNRDIKVSPIGWTTELGCLGWPAPVRNPQHTLRIHGAPPILMLNSRYDPATPYEWATDAARQSGAVLLTYDGWGHGAYFKNSDCVVAAADHYLITGRTPARGTHCAAVEPPNTPTLTVPGPQLPPGRF